MNKKHLSTSSMSLSSSSSERTQALFLKYEESAAFGLRDMAAELPGVSVVGNGQPKAQKSAASRRPMSFSSSNSRESKQTATSRI